jgi:hypothetical protein
MLTNVKAQSTWTLAFIALACLVGIGVLGGVGRTLSNPAAAGLDLPGRATPAPFVLERTDVIEFRPFIASDWGLQLSVPKAAVRSEGPDEITFTYNDEQIFGTLVVDLQRVPTRGESAADALQSMSGGLSSASPIERASADGGRLVGARLTYSSLAGSHCAAPRSVIAVFVDLSYAYVIRISADAAGRCDAQALPQTDPIIDSLRLGGRR